MIQSFLVSPECRPSSTAGKLSKTKTVEPYSNRAFILLSREENILVNKRMSSIKSYEEKTENQGRELLMMCVLR